jgi:hypothetical protein
MVEHRGRNGGRLYVRDARNDVLEIVGKSGKNIKNQNFVIKILKELYD